jgi:uncharacterized membrane protein YgcG
MKKILFILLIYLAVLFWPQGILAQARPHEHIEDMQVDIYIQPDANIDIKETIVYDFGSERKHGIYRDIPLSYTDFWLNYDMKLKDVSVTDETGRVYRFRVSNASGGKQIKIGDANKTILGVHTYVIDYTVTRAMTFEEDYDELYWNAIGNKWLVAIHNSRVNLYYPEFLDKSEFSIDCYYGAQGSQDYCLQEQNILINDRIVGTSFTVGQLTAGTGATILTKLPKGLVTEPTTAEKIVAAILQNLILLLPIVAFVAMFIYWRRKGRDPEGRGVIIAQYEPPEDMMPAEAGTIVDEGVNHRDIAAEIIYLAIQGYIKITRIKKGKLFSKDDYFLEKLRDEKDLPREYQKELIANLFSKPAKQKKLDKLEGIELHPDAQVRVFMSDFKNKAYKWMVKVEDDMYKSTVDRGYFPKSPKKVKAMYGILLMVAIFGFFGLGKVGVLSSGPRTLMFLAMIFISLVIVAMFGMQMSRRTQKGVYAKEYILGLKEYIEVAEKARIDFHNAPEKDPQLFEKLLPYAMALGIEKKWAKQFESIYTQEPSWYHNANAGVYFSATAFGDSLHGFQTNSGSSLSSRPSSGGSGGFSGGGGGGGGGGSW